MMDILKTDKLTKIYGREENKVEALKDVSISVERVHCFTVWRDWTRLRRVKCF